MRTLAIDDLDEWGSNAPRVEFINEREFYPAEEVGASSYRSIFSNGARLDALLINKNSDVLVVGLHGATNRETTLLPRYERLRSIGRHPVSAMFFADPSLWLDERLQLAWYTGCDCHDISKTVAEWISVTANRIGARHIVISGASGGGFASLQVPSHLPGSLALAFNPQTDISAYRINGESFGAQLEYVRVLWPDVYANLKHGKIFGIPGGRM